MPLPRVAVAGVLVVLSACSAGTDGSAQPTQQASSGSASMAPTPASSKPHVSPPPVNGQFDYQIGGVYRPDAAVTIVDRDVTADAVAGTYNICYVNAFQTQPGESRFWRTRHPRLLLRDHDGSYVKDPNWPDEMLLDTSTVSKRSAIAAIMKVTFDDCLRKGFQAVEPDNLDSWTRSRSRLAQADNVAMATLLATRAHADGLAIAQKNTSELGVTGRTKVHFDFAIAEECQVYSECGSYLRAYGRHVIEIEYTDNKRGVYTKACAAQGRSISVILRDRQVVRRGGRGYRYESC